MLEQQRVLVHGAWWVQVRLPLRPAGQIGWVPQWTLGAPQTVHTYVVVSTEKMTLTLYRDGKVDLHHARGHRQAQHAHASRPVLHP